MRAREFIIEGSNTSLENAVDKMIGGYLHGRTREKNTCYAHVGQELARLKPDDATIRFWGRKPNLIVHGDAVLPDGTIISTISPDRYEKVRYEMVDTMPLDALLSKLPDSLDEDDEPVMSIKIKGPDPKVKAWIEKVYSLYPQTWQNNHIIPLGGEGDDQQFALFELTPSFSKRGAVEVKWIQAYPLRQGVGGRAMKILQNLAQQDGIALTLFPWDKGRVPQSKLIKFYKKQGFNPASKGSKNMVWEPATDK
jgi:hypothetical protein